MNVRVYAEQHIEVHKFYGGSVAVVSFFALVVQAFLNKYGGRFELLELPLLVTIYFGMSRRNPISGLFLGTIIGLLQDGISHLPIGVYGIAKTFVGYLASSIGARLDTEHPVSRFILTFLFFHFQQMILAITSRLLLAQSAPFFNFKLLVASLISAAVAVPLYSLLDRLRKRS